MSPGHHLPSQLLWPPGAAADEVELEAGFWSLPAQAGLGVEARLGETPLAQTPLLALRARPSQQGAGALFLLAHLCCSQSVPWGHCQIAAEGGVAPRGKKLGTLKCQARR